MFNGFPEETILFFLGLRFNNDSSYFNAHRDDYIKQVQTPFYSFIEQLAPHMQQIDKAMEIRPAKCLARIRRDTRFTKDKSPYRDHLWLQFRRGGESKEHSVMFWFELGPDSVSWGLGFWGENKPALELLRKQMVAKPRKFLSVINSCKLEEHNMVLEGEEHKRIVVPEGLSEKLVPWYKKKQLYICKQSVQMPIVYNSNIAQLVTEDYLSLAPIYQMLRGAVDQIELQEE